MEYFETTSSVATAGDVYGNYIIKGLFKREEGYTKYALVSCSCGSPERYIKLDCLRSGSAQSCGCLHKQAVTKHGLHKNPVFKSWKNMMRRCYNPKDTRYIWYGARGIIVCERWHDHDNFMADMADSFVSGLTLDRIDNNGNYELSNCRWSTVAEQVRNCSRNVLIEYNGVTLCLADWALKKNMCYGTLWERYKTGWSTERMMTTPVRKLTR